MSIQCNIESNIYKCAKYCLQLTVLCSGRKRFKVLSSEETPSGYLVGRVEFFDDKELLERQPAINKRAVRSSGLPSSSSSSSSLSAASAVAASLLSVGIDTKPHTAAASCRVRSYIRAMVDASSTIDQSLRKPLALYLVNRFIPSQTTPKTLSQRHTTTATTTN
jgi:hypothetical protein